MYKKAKWSDDYWLLLMQIYLQRPVGIKPMYSRKMVELSLELHIAPNVLYNRMCQMANLQTPRIEHIWETYGNNPRKLSRAVRCNTMILSQPPSVLTSRQGRHE